MGTGPVNDGCPPSAKVATGHFHTVFKLIPKCIGGIDADGDGYCTVGGTGVPNDPNDANASRIPETYSQFRPFVVAHAGSGTNPPAAREPKQVCDDGIDNDGDTLIDLLDGTSAGGVTTDNCPGRPTRSSRRGRTRTGTGAGTKSRFTSGRTRRRAAGADSIPTAAHRRLVGRWTCAGSRRSARTS